MLSATLISAIIAWSLAQIIKIIISVVHKKRFDFVWIWSSGGMPSSHSSTVTAMATSCGYIAGWDSEIFAIACILAIIVMYDAAGVRRAVGEQAKILNRIVFTSEAEEKRPIEKELKELIGHTPLQVFLGGLLGIAIGLLYPWLSGAVPYAA